MKILVVDDENAIIQGLISIISGFGLDSCVVKGSDNVYTALDILDEFRPELVITDINMPVMNGFELIEQANKKYLNTRFVILTGYDEFDYARQAIRCRAVDYLLKPIIKEELFDVIRKVGMDDTGKKDAGETFLQGIEQFVKEIDKQRLSYHLSKILDYIDVNYNKNISLINLSEYSGMNANYICMLFRKELELSYLNYLDNVRLKKASDFLLNDHKKTIHDIANSIGYQTERQFFKMFKKKTGITPNQFRELYGNTRKAGGLSH